MTSLGFLTLKNSIDHTYLNEIAKQSKDYGIQIYHFTPLDIEPETERITGKVFDHHSNGWKKETFQMPDFIYDRCFYTGYVGCVTVDLT